MQQHKSGAGENLKHKIESDYGRMGSILQVWKLLVTKMWLEDQK